MLLSFSVSNFKSFRDEQVLDLTASTLKPAFSWLEKAAVPIGKEESALRVKALYGANASGKSNLLEAFFTMIGVGLLSSRRRGVLSGVIPFVFDESLQSKPSSFEATFIVDGKRYEYGFVVDRQQFHQEWLHDVTIRKAEVFSRNGQDIKINKKYFHRLEAVNLLTRTKNKVFRKDTSFLSALSQFDSEPAIKATVQFFSSIDIIGDTDAVFIEQNAYVMLKDDRIRGKVRELMKFADINFEKLLVLDREAEKQSDSKIALQYNLQNTRGQYSVLATHAVEGNDTRVMSWLTEQGESKGTQKLLVLAPYIIRTIENGGILVIDEFEAKLHTRLSREIVAMFNSAAGNPNNAQFIFSTHDTNLLDHRLLRRDQIDFVEKEADRSSTVYSLSDVKGIRKEADFERDYLGGSYGAVPEVTDFNIAILED